MPNLSAVVTGSSSGIGRAIALELAAAGAAVFLHARRSEDALRQVAAEVERRGTPARFALADLADPGTHVGTVEQAFAWRGGVDVWVNNAGADVLTGEAARLSFDEKLEVLWRVDVVATIRLSRLADFVHGALQPPSRRGKFRGESLLCPVEFRTCRLKSPRKTFTTCSRRATRLCWSIVVNRTSMTRSESLAHD